MSGKLVAQYRKGLAIRAASDLVDQSGSNNLFGTIGTGLTPLLSKMGFIPEDGAGNVIDLTGSTNGDSRPQWIGLSTKIMQFWAYVYCSPLATVIDRLAEADTNGIVRFVDEDGVFVKNVNKVPRLARMKKLLDRPNPWQTWEEFEGEQVSWSKIFGYCPVFAVNPGFEDKTFTTALLNLYPLKVTPIRNWEYSPFKKGSQIAYWEFTYFGETLKIASEDVFLVKDSFVCDYNNFDLPMSKINGLDFQVSNICAAAEADNVILKKKGPLGVFSYQPSKDMAGTTPSTGEEKDELQKDLRRYGLTIGQLQYVISRMPVKYEAISFNLRDLMTKETTRQAIDIICDRFGYAAELMSGKNATYENRNTSEKWIYNNGVIPYSRRRMQNYNQYFSLEGIKMTKDFSDLPVLQEDIVKAGEAAFYEAQGLQIEWAAGTLTWNQWQIAKGRDKVDGMDIYFPEYIKKYPTMNPNQKQLGNGKDTSSKDSSSKK